MNRVEIIRNGFDQSADMAEKIILTALSEFGLDNCFLELSFVSAKEIQILNKKYRDVDKETDVLSFPQIDIPKSSQKILGDIVISPEIAAKKNEDLKDVIKHGLLHLLGYDHEANEDAWDEAALKINCKL